MTHLLKLEEAVFVEVDAVEVKHALAVQAPASIQGGQSLQDLVRYFDKLLLAKVSIFRLLRTIDVHETGII